MVGTGVDPRPVVVYLSYDGMLEPLGQSQVVAYLEQLATDYGVHLVSFEKPEDLMHDERVKLLSQRLRDTGIIWHPRRYHKHPRILSTLWDMAAAILLASWLAVRHHARILHARSVLCAAMLYPAKLASGARFLVDIRGFWADERVDGGIIQAGGTVYRVLKVIEKAMLRRADHVVTLTEASVPYLRGDPRLGRTTAPITVIPTCADLALFSPGDAPDEVPLTIGYVGQIGTWYMLDEMLAVFAAIRRLRPDVRLLIVNKQQQETIRAAVERFGIDPAIVEIRGVDRDEVPVQVRRMHAAMALIRPCFSKIASAPTKLGEYLGCGVPVIGNAGCGDMARIIADDGVGVAMADTGPEAIEAAAHALMVLLDDPALAARCVASAHRRFSLDEGVARYRSIYRSLVGIAA